MVKRHEIQVLRRAGHGQAEVARLVGVSKRSVERVDGEEAVTAFDTNAERDKRRIGRPSKAEPFRSFLVGELIAQPDVLAVELLRRAKNKGYSGGKSALYEFGQGTASRVRVPSFASKDLPANSRSTTSGTSTCASSMVASSACTSLLRVSSTRAGCR